MAKIRKYNQAFAMTSMRCDIDMNLASDRDGIYTVRINGELCHMVGPLQPDNGEPARFAQILWLDPEEQVVRRQELFLDLDTGALWTVQNAMQNNQLVRMFVAARNIAVDSPNVRLVISGSVPRGEHPRRYNTPQVPEVAAVVLDDGASFSQRELVLRRIGGGLMYVPGVPQDVRGTVLPPVLSRRQSRMGNRLRCVAEGLDSVPSADTKRTQRAASWWKTVSAVGR